MAKDGWRQQQQQEQLLHGRICRRESFKIGQELAFLESHAGSRDFNWYDKKNPQDGDAREDLHAISTGAGAGCIEVQGVGLYKIRQNRPTDGCGRAVATVE
jgi:hypothetical protein